MITHRQYWLINSNLLTCNFAKSKHFQERIINCTLASSAISPGRLQMPILCFTLGAQTRMTINLPTHYSAIILGATKILLFKFPILKLFNCSDIFYLNNHFKYFNKILHHFKLNIIFPFYKLLLTFIEKQTKKKNLLKTQYSKTLCSPHTNCAV